MNVQQINLLDPRLLTLRVMFSARILAWTLLAVIALGLVLYAVVGRSTGEIRQQLDQTQARRDALQARLDALAQPSEALQANAALQAKGLREQQAQVEHLRAMQSALASGRHAGFSARLQALAREGLPGVWLTAVEIDDEAFQLKGRALDSAQIPDYLAVLARQPALKDLPLTGFSIAAPEPETARDDAAPVQGIAFVVNPQAEAK